jgi:hypothetical protein
MNTLLLTVPVGRKRDVVVARQRARQIASVLGFGAHEQSCIAAAVFELTRQALATSEHATIHFEVAQNALHVFPQGVKGERSVRLEKPLPVSDNALAREDLSWVIRELVQRTPETVFEEINRQNQELLVVLLELRECQARLAQALQEQNKSTAA